MTYNDYLIKITETVKIRSTNFRLSQNDIIYMTNNVYYEIMSRVNIKPYRQDVLIVEDTLVYDLDALYTMTDNSMLFDTYAIRDSIGVDIGRYFRKINDHTFMIKEEIESIFFEKYLDETIYFYREQVPDIVNIHSRVQFDIFEAIIAGIMYYTHSAIPSPTSSQVPFSETGMYKTLYDKAINNLMNKYPQR